MAGGKAPLPRFMDVYSLAGVNSTHQSLCFPRSLLITGYILKWNFSAMIATLKITLGKSICFPISYLLYTLQYCLLYMIDTLPSPKYSISATTLVLMLPFFASSISSFLIAVQIRVA